MIVIFCDKLTKNYRLNLAFHALLQVSVNSVEYGFKNCSLLFANYFRYER